MTEEATVQLLLALPQYGALIWVIYQLIALLKQRDDDH